jgi:hypothetical protein
VVDARVRHHVGTAVTTGAVVVAPSDSGEVDRARRPSRAKIEDQVLDFEAAF